MSFSEEDKKNIIKLFKSKKQIRTIARLFAPDGKISMEIIVEINKIIEAYLKENNKDVNEEEETKSDRTEITPEEENEIIELRKKGATYIEIYNYFYKKARFISMESIKAICEKYNQPKRINNKRKLGTDLEELIYNSRNEGESYARIKEKVDAINDEYIGAETLRKRGKEIFAKKGEDEPLHMTKYLKYKEYIYGLRQKKMSYAEIERAIYEEKGEDLSNRTIAKWCKAIYSEKGEEEPVKERNVEEKNVELINKEGIFRLREMGITQTEIQKILRAEGIEIKEATLSQILKDIYIEKGKEQPRGNKNEKNKKKVNEIVEKIGKQKLAKMILDLIYTKKATLEQVKIMAEYYGVDLSKTMDSLEERELY